MRALLEWMFLFVLFLSDRPIAVAQQKSVYPDITADSIIQRAISNAGGEVRLAAIGRAEFMSQLIDSNNDTLFVSVKRQGYNKCYISVMSYKFENTTTIFNNGRAVFIRNDSATNIADPEKLEELALNCYSSIEYGYKKLGYKLRRIEDLHEGRFDCYGVLAESPLGTRTANYYDKKTGNCTMIMYPTGGRTIFTGFLPYKGSVYARNMLLGDAKGRVSRSELREINIDENTDDTWFHIPRTGISNPLAGFKTGHFRYIDGKDTLIKIERIGSKQIEIAKGAATEYRIEWFSPSEYVLYRLKNVSAPPTNDNIEFIKCRITLWSDNHYCCQYITSTGEVGTCTLKKNE